FFCGFSTASILAQADSSPRKAHNVMEMDVEMAEKKSSLLGFHALAYNDGLNQNQPRTHSPTTGMITPHTVTEPICPVIFAPPKLHTVVIHSTTMVARQTPTGESSTPSNTLP